MKSNRNLFGIGLLRILVFVFRNEQTVPKRIQVGQIQRMLFIVGAEESDIRSHHSVRKVVLSVHIALLVMQNENNKVCHLVVFVPVCQVLYLLFSKTILAEIIYDIVQRLISDIQLVFAFVVVVVELFEITIILEFLGRNEFQTGIFLNMTILMAAGSLPLRTEAGSRTASLPAQGRWDPEKLRPCATALCPDMATKDLWRDSWTPPGISISALSSLP